MEFEQRERERFVLFLKSKVIIYYSYFEYLRIQIMIDESQVDLSHFSNNESEIGSFFRYFYSRYFYIFLIKIYFSKSLSIDEKFRSNVT